MNRLLRSTIAVLTATIVLGSFAATAYSAASACAAVTTTGEWTTIPAPEFPAGPVGMTSYSIDPHNPATIFVTNGVVIMRTRDGGCSWNQAFSLELLPSLDKPISSANSAIKEIVVPEAVEVPTTRSVYAVIEEKVGPAARPHLAASYDTGRSWTVHQQGLPPVTGGVLGFAVAPSDPDILYLQVRHNPAGADDVVYASRDAGATWEQRSTPGDGVAVNLTVDPQDPEELWLWSGELYHSLDGARTRQHEAFATSVTMVDVYRPRGGESRVMAYEAETQTFSVSVDSGQTWARIPGPLIFAHSITHGSGVFDVVVSGHNGVYRFDPPQFWLPIHPKDQPDLYDLQATRSGDTAIFGRSTENTLERYNALDEEVTLDPFDSVGDAVIGGATQLTPGTTTVRLKPGASKRIDYQLGLPPHPTPLDVFFLVDTSASMESSINGLRAGMQQVITDLENARLDVQFGVGEYKDYPIPGYGSPEAGDFPYRLNRSIGPADAALADALERLEATGGGRDEPESQLTGLYQAATGEGEPGFVPAGQDAGFRPGSLKVIVHVTDARFHHKAAHPSPPFDQVVEALRSRNILQIGLAVWGPNGPDGEDDLISMAEETNTVAPAGGIDCDGDGHIDVAGGQPLTCVVASEDRDGVMSLAPAIISTLKAVTANVAVELRTERSPYVAEVEPSLYPTYNVKDAGRLPFSVTFTCPRHLADSRAQLDLSALVDGRPQAEATTRVICLPPRPFEEADNILPLLVPALLGPLAPLAPPPLPPPPITESAPGTQQMFQAQAAAAAQEQEEVQTAAAWQAAVRERVAEEYEFSSFADRTRAAPPAPLYAAAALMALGFAAAVSLRSRTVALARARR